MPKGKRAEWARQSKQELSEIRHKFHGYIPDPTLVEVMGFVGKDFNVPHSVKLNFFLTHKESMVKVSKKWKIKPKDVRTNYEANLLKWANNPKNKQEFDSMFAEVTRDVALKASPNAVKALQKKANEYLEERKILSDAKIIDRTITEMFGKSKLSGLLSSFNFREFERNYLNNLKIRRFGNQFLGRRFNFFIELAFPDVRLTSKQRRTVKKWLQRNSEKMYLKPVLESGLTSRTETEKIKQYIEIEKRFIDACRAEFLKQFVQQIPKSSVKKSVSDTFGKSGTREERMAGYQRTETESASSRKRKLKSRQIRAVTVKTPFNVLEYCLSEISNTSAVTGKFFRNLVKAGTLKENGLVGLYTSGNLNQRVFREVLSQTNFERQFGTRNINVLARGIAHVGPQGKKVDHVKRAFQSPRAEEIYNFLVKNDFLDTAHGKNMVYLTRF